ncbi:hypothetical protein [Rhizobium bangladeshense]|uniref:hypothetical protein n=1 Tax=Rhizobium bangladeshense TaxID=1138189 RepID=UPI0007E5735E|nr:hypothetical protein [Rhizobium bangladeshense]
MTDTLVVIVAMTSALFPIAERYLLAPVQEAHAALTEGTEKLSALDRERAALDRANARVIRCADHIDDFNARQIGTQSTPNFDGKSNAR